MEAEERSRATYNGKAIVAYGYLTWVLEELHKAVMNL
jgi:hypothetical protein